MAAFHTSLQTNVGQSVRLSLSRFRFTTNQMPSTTIQQKTAHDIRLRRDKRSCQCFWCTVIDLHLGPRETPLAYASCMNAYVCWNLTKPTRKIRQTCRRLDKRCLLLIDEAQEMINLWYRAVYTNFKLYTRRRLKKATKQSTLYHLRLA